MLAVHPEGSSVSLNEPVDHHGARDLCAASAPSERACEKPSAPPSSEASGGSVEPADRTGLSTDYLNHYSEVLMLIELAAFDEAVVEELSQWQPIGYRDYFLRSPLRRAGSAIAAYDALEAGPRIAFEQTIQALDKLAQGAILALQPPCHPQNVIVIGEVIGPGIRRLIDRAAAFLNSDGLARCDRDDDSQALIDRIIA